MSLASLNQCPLPQVMRGVADAHPNLRHWIDGLRHSVEHLSVKDARNADLVARKLSDRCEALVRQYPNYSSDIALAHQILGEATGAWHQQWAASEQGNGPRPAGGGHANGRRGPAGKRVGGAYQRR